VPTVSTVPAVLRASTAPTVPAAPAVPTVAPTQAVSTVPTVQTVQTVPTVPTVPATQDGAAQGIPRGFEARGVPQEGATDAAEPTPGPGDELAGAGVVGPAADVAGPAADVAGAKSAPAAAMGAGPAGMGRGSSAPAWEDGALHRASSEPAASQPKSAQGTTSQLEPARVNSAGQQPFAHGQFHGPGQSLGHAHSLSQTYPLSLRRKAPAVPGKLSGSSRGPGEPSGKLPGLPLGHRQRQARAGNGGGRGCQLAGRQLAPCRPPAWQRAQGGGRSS